MKFKICARCGFKNVYEAKYCAGCGTKLEEVELEGEIKRCCVSFLEISNYEELKDEFILEEEFKDFLLILSQEINSSVEKYEGKVGKFMWPEIMIWFGAPKIVENPYERVILSIFDIKNKIKEISNIKNVNISIKAGVHYGEAVLCLLGNKDYKEYTLIGDTVNTAQRVKEVAGEDEIVITEALSKKLSKIFELKEKGKFLLKGKKEEINLYKVIEPKKERGKIRGIEGLYSEMVGREKEMEEALFHFEKFLIDKKLKGIIIMGEPGIGKSRFLFEFIKNIEKYNVKVYETKFLPFGQTVYFPFESLLKKIIEIKEDDNRENIKNRIDEFVNTIFPKERLKEIKILEVLYDFFGIESLKEKFESSIFQNILFYTFKTIFEKLSKEGLLFCIEDFHWADPSSLSLLHYLIEFLREREIFIVIVSRPLYEKGEIFKFLEHLKEEKDFKEISLKELKEEETNLLIENLLNIAVIKPYLKEIIYKKSEGNPLYIEEILKILIEKGFFEKVKGKWVQIKDISEIEIPDTLEEIILSRVDNLPLMEKVVLQRASVIGRNFWDIILQELVERPVFYYLQNLEKLDFIRHKGEAGIFIGIEYIFKHYLIREAIYRSIIEEIKKKVHLKVAETLERIILPEHIRNYYKSLAYHFERGENFEKSAFYYLENGKILKDKSLYYEALEDFEKVKEISDKYNVLKEKKFEINLNLAEILSRLGKKDKAMDVYNEVFNFVKNEEEEYNLYYSLSDHYQSISDYKSSAYFLEKASSVAKDNIKKIKVLLFSSWLNYLTGALDLAINDLNNAFEILNKEQIDSDRKNSFLISIYDRFAIYKMDEGKLDEAIEDFERAIELSEKIQKIERIGTLYNNLGDTLRCAGKIEKAEEILLKAKEWAEKTGDMLLLAIVHNNLGELYNDIGMNDLAEEKFKFYLELNKKIRNRLGDGYGNLGLGRIYMDKNDLKNAEERFLEALKIFEEVKSKRMLNFGKCDFVLLKIAQRKFEEAESLIYEILSYAVSTSLDELIYRSYVLKILLLWKKYSEDTQKLYEIFDIEREARKFEKNVFNFIYTLKLRETLFMVSQKLERETKKYYEEFKNFLDEIILNMNEEKRNAFVKKYGFSEFLNE
ncbi:MAG: tetratricopeptide repeat protein [Candidatus Hydrothermales bacterium]